MVKICIEIYRNSPLKKTKELILLLQDYLKQNRHYQKTYLLMPAERKLIIQIKQIACINNRSYQIHQHYLSDSEKYKESDVYSV